MTVAYLLLLILFIALAGRLIYFVFVNIWQDDLDGPWGDEFKE